MLEKLNISESDLIQLRFLGALCMIMAASIKRTNSFYLRTAISFAILWMAYGVIHLMIIIFVIILNLLLMQSKLINEYFFIFMNIFILYLYKIFGWRLEPRIQTTFDISGFMMVFVVKASYLASEWKERYLFNNTESSDNSTNVNLFNNTESSDNSTNAKSNAKLFNNTESSDNSTNAKSNVNLFNNTESSDNSTNAKSNAKSNVKPRHKTEPVDSCNNYSKSLNDTNDNEHYSRQTYKTILKAEVESKETAQSRKANIRDAIDFLLFIPGLVSGPTATFSEFMAANRQIKKEIRLTSALKPLVFLLLYFYLGKLDFKYRMVDPNNTFFLKLIFLYLFNFGMRNKFYFIWHFADLCFHLHGFDSLLNIDFYKVELCQDVREISSNWNKFISRWLKIMFFNKLKKWSIKWAVLITHLISACLHGFNVCYLIFFFSFAIFSTVVTRLNKYIRYTFLRQFIMILFVSFFSIPFYILDVTETYHIMKSLNFFGWLIFGGAMLIFIIYDIIKLCLNTFN